MISYSHLPGTVFYKLVPKIYRLKFTYFLSILSICAGEVQLKPYYLPVSLQTHMSLLFKKTAHTNIHFQICHRLVQPLPQKKEDYSSYNNASLSARCSKVTALTLHYRGNSLSYFGHSSAQHIVLSLCLFLKLLQKHQWKSNNMKYL